MSGVLQTESGGAGSAERAAHLGPDLSPRMAVACLAIAVCAPLAAVGGRVAAEIGLVALLYLAVMLAIAWGLRSRRRAGLESRLDALVLWIDVLGVTAMLVFAGQLGGPLVGLYAPIVFAAGVAGGQRALLASASATLALYAGAHVLVAAGLLPDRPGSFGSSAAATPGERASLVLLCAAILASTVITARQYGGRLRLRLGAVEEGFRAIFEHGGNPMAVVDPASGRLLEANAAMRGLFSADLASVQSPPDLDGDRVLRGLFPAGEHARLRQAFLATLEPASAPETLTVAALGGRQLDLTFSAVSLRGYRNVIVVVKDSTERLRLEDAQRRYAETLESEVSRRTRDLERLNQDLRGLQSRLIEAERLSTAGELAGGVAHAIYNPLTAVLGRIQMRLESADEPDPEDVKLYGLVHRIERVVEGMLQLSRRGTLRPSDVDPRAVLESVQTEVAHLAQARGVRVLVQVDPSARSVLADRELLTTALASIAENGIDATEPGGEVVLEADSIAGAGVVVFGVSDGGGGIPEALRRRVFEPFFTTKPKGAGLGLAIAHGIVRGHEGRIRIHDRPGGGTIVTVELPLRARAPSLRPREFDASV